MNAMMTSPIERSGRPRSGDALVPPSYRQRRALEEHERAELKRADLAEQYSPSNGADARIRAWERVHKLSMPSDSRHPVLDAIASATQLTLAEVQNEQRLRYGRPAAAGV